MSHQTLTDEQIEEQELQERRAWLGSPGIPLNPDTGPWAALPPWTFSNDSSATGPLVFWTNDPRLPDVPKPEGTLVASRFRWDTALAESGPKAGKRILIGFHEMWLSAADQ